MKSNCDNSIETMCPEKMPSYAKSTMHITDNITTEALGTLEVNKG